MKKKSEIRQFRPSRWWSVEEQILKAWNRGERKISDIMKITGCTYKTVRRYIPESAAD